MKKKSTTKKLPAPRKKFARRTPVPGARGGTLLFSGADARHASAAAEMLAEQMGASVLRVDLAKIASPYAGETEKSLGRLLARAERDGAVLLFDEAEGLFGKRTPVKDAHDRYAEGRAERLIELLEEFRGVAIITTRSERNLDRSFARRFAPLTPPKPRAKPARAPSVVRKRSK